MSAEFPNHRNIATKTQHDSASGKASCPGRFPVSRMPLAIGTVLTRSKSRTCGIWPISHSSEGSAAFPNGRVRLASSL
jgi:hypothetical protein